MSWLSAPGRQTAAARIAVQAAGRIRERRNLRWGLGPSGLRANADQGFAAARPCDACCPRHPVGPIITAL